MHFSCVITSYFLQFRRSLVTGKDIKYGNDCRALLLQGVEKLAQAVETTLGPKVSLLSSLAPHSFTLLTKNRVEMWC
jgi:hypothetical protein